MDGIEGMINPFYYLGLVTGLIFGIMAGAGIYYYFSIQRRKVEKVWNELLGKTILYSVRRNQGRHGYRAFDWGEVRQGKVQEVRPTAKLIQINNYWYKWWEIKYIDLVRKE